MVLRATLITVAVGVIVYKCKKWCADVVARIEAIESTIQIMQNPPSPRPGTFASQPTRRRGVAMTFGGGE